MAFKRFPNAVRRIPLTRAIRAHSVGVCFSSLSWRSQVVPRKPQGIASRHYASPAQAGPGPDGEVDFLLADIGEGIAEVEVLKWFIKEGDTIEQFDKVAEVQSDKATVEITSRYDGIVTKVYYKAHDVAKVGAPLIRIKAAQRDQEAGAGVDPSETKAKLAAAPPTHTPVSGHHHSDAAVAASPAVRRIARENNIDLSQVQASGPKGRILKEDVLNYLSRGGSAPSALSQPQVSHQATPSLPPPPPPPPAARRPPAAPTHSPSPPAVAAVSPTAAASVSAKSKALEDKVVPITGLQRIMVQTMTAANAVPSFGYSDEICVDDLIKVRERLKPIVDQTGIKITYFAFLVKAASLALTQFPQLNAHVDKDCQNLIIKGSHNISLAMDTPRGLLVPNIKNVQDLNILQIAQELSRLGELGKNNKLGTDDLTGGTFTLSNIGTIGGTVCRPILVVPQIVIGALGKFMVVPRYNHHKELKPSTIFTVSWSADHRVVDGATMARFSNLWKSYIENPTSMIVAVK